MNCKFINVLMFAAGAAIGSTVTWKVVKTKYERIVQEEIDSVKETFANNFANRSDINEDVTENNGDDSYHQVNWSELEDLNEEEDEDEDDEDDKSEQDYLRDYGRLIDRYTNNNNEKGGAENMAKEPYVISPYDFGEIDEYHKIELTYYADGILEDEDYSIINDADELIGPKALTTFGEYEDDAVFVRNERLSTDFQILKDYRTYDEARSVGPNKVRD